jgi:hypothetical protein
MIGDAHGPAMVAAIDVAAQIFGSAVQQVIDDFAVLGPQRVLVLIIGNMWFENVGNDTQAFVSGLMIGWHGAVLFPYGVASDPSGLGTFDSVSRLTCR